MQNGGQQSPVAMQNKAVKAALAGNWEEAVELNSQIIDLKPNDIKAKIRLGRAYLQLKEFSKAKKLFNEVLEADPINQVAKKNLELAKKNKTDNKTPNSNAKNLIKEPGTTAKVSMETTARGVTADNFSPGEEFDLKVLKTKIKVLSKDKELGEINSDLAKKLNSAAKKHAKISAHFSGGEGKAIDIIIKSSVPVFKSEKQEVKPYIRKGTIEEPELEIPLLDDDE